MNDEYEVECEGLRFFRGAIIGVVYGLVFWMLIYCTIRHLP